MHTFHDQEPTLSAVHHLAFRSASRGETVDFYTHIMSLSVLNESERSTWLALGATVLMIEDAAPGEATMRAHSMDFLAFACTRSELSKWRERFEGYGIQLEHSTELTLYVRDPDGRRVGVSAYPF